METVDLNLSNYSLNEILDLFKLNINFNSYDLKNAKKTVLMTHPDKSGLPSNYFQFYTKAYELLFRVYKFKEKDESLSNKEKNNDYFVDRFDRKNKESEFIILQKQGLLNKDLTASKDFLNKFNQMFEKYVIQNKEDDGYEDWLKSNDDEFSNDLTLSQVQEKMEQKRKELGALIRIDDIKHISSADYVGASDFLNEKVDSYESPIFGGALRYDDLKKVHTENVVPVTIDDYNQKEKFANINQLKLHRDSMIKGVDWSEYTAKKKLDLNNERLNEEDCNRYYNLMKEQERVMEINKRFWKDLKQIDN